MRILILSFYYPPDLSAGSFRAQALVEALRRQQPENMEISVVTSLPNRYGGYAVEAAESEDVAGVNIRRVRLPSHRSGMLDQSHSYLVFGFRVARLVAAEHYDAVFATSSRLMTAVLGAWIARRKKCPLYLDIRDIFVDTIRDLIPKPITFAVIPVLAALERQAIGTAARVNLVSPGFAEYFSERYPARSFRFFTNGIDDEFIHQDFSSQSQARKDDRRLTVLYAGNIGEGQGLHGILPELARAMAARLRFRVVGDGGRKAELREAIKRHRIENLELLPPVNRRELIAEYCDADVLFLHLNDHAAFEKVLPSKIFEYAATGKPIWAGVAGYPAEFLRKEVDNVAVFEPCNADQASREFESLSLAISPRTGFVEKYSRVAIMRAMAADLVSTIDAGRNA